LNGFANWNGRQLEDYLQYKKNDSDKAMPKKVGPLRLKCQEVMRRTSPIASPHQSDDETSVIEENNEESLVGMCDDVVQPDFSKMYQDLSLINQDKRQFFFLKSYRS
jgi:hypothetical protein